MTRYFTAVADELLPELTGRRMPRGLQLVRQIGPSGAPYRHMTLVEFEDDLADANYAGLVVSPVFRATYTPDGQMSYVEISGRYIDPVCPVFCDLGQGDQPPGPIEWCRIGRHIEHAIHVSGYGYYRWDAAGKLVPTPHFSDPDFDALYRADPLGQLPWEP